jgi:hypothetical protein
MDTVLFLRRKLLSQIAARPAAFRQISQAGLRPFLNGEFTTFTMCNVSDEEFAFFRDTLGKYRREENY